MDFSLIEDHPWITAGAVLGGGFLLYLVIHHQSSGGGGTTVVSTAGQAPQVDPTVAAQITAQQQQLQAQLAGLTIQGNTQIGLAQISANVQTQTAQMTQDVTNKQTAAAQEVQDTTTAAQLQLGLGTLDAQVQGKQIDAAVQIANINAILAAFGVSKANTVGSTPVSNSSGNPVQVIYPPTNVTVNAPTYSTPTPSVPGGNYQPVQVTNPTWTTQPATTSGANSTGGGTQYYNPFGTSGPTFDPSAYATGAVPQGANTGYNPVYFASPATAQQVATMLGGTVVGSDQMTSAPGTTIMQSEPNLMVALPGGGQVNAGVIADMYTHNWPQSFIDQQIQAEVAYANANPVGG
jgi:hypothetical protein